jgi:hypothetical protein
MSYSSWFRQHGEKHARIMEKLSSCSDDEIIAYFRFENMVEHEPDFCPLYRERKKCHEMENLNCYLCACPYFRFNDAGFKEVKGKKLQSYCSIEAKGGTLFEGEEAWHQDCSGCTIPHHEHYIKKHFQRDWFKIMQDVVPAGQS